MTAWIRLAWVSAALVLGAAMGTPAQSPAPVPRFVDVAKAWGVSARHVNGASAEKFLAETMGSGGALVDVDDDGWLDVLLVGGGSLRPPMAAQHRLYRNGGNGRFVDVSTTAGLGAPAYGMGACAGDVDGDARVDLYLTGYMGNALYRNQGKGAFVDITRAAGVGLGTWSTSCAFVDADADGDLDLFVANYLDAPMSNNRFCGDAQRRIRVYCHPLNYKGVPSVLFRNDGKGTFTDVSEAAGLAAYAGNGLGVAVGDYDDDGRPDVFVANDGVPNYLFHNVGGGRFEEVGLVAGVSVARDGKPRAGMGTEFADYDNDGRLDLVVTNHEFETHSLFRNGGRGIFDDVTVASGLGPPTLPYVGFGVAFADFDNSGLLDLVIVNGHVIDNTALFRAGSTHAQRKLLLRNTNGRRFQEVARQAGPGFSTDGVGRSLLSGDLDNDGDVDLVATNNGGLPEILRNDGEAGHAMILRLVGAAGRDAVGARVTVRAGGRSQTREVKSGSGYLGQSDLRLHVGLGDVDRVDRLEIRWPGGVAQAIEAPPADRRLTIREGRGIARSEPFTSRSTSAP